jgi:hypothetical protein
MSFDVDRMWKVTGNGQTDPECWQKFKWPMAWAHCNKCIDIINHLIR